MPPSHELPRGRPSEPAAFLGRAGNRDAKALHLIAEGAVTSRAQLREQLAISPSTASALVKKLLDAGAIIETGSGQSTGGRRPTLLTIAPTSRMWAVAELGGEHVRQGLVTPSGEITAVEETPVDVSSGPEATISHIAERWSSLAAETNPSARILAGAIALPGPVNSRTGELVSPARMPGWNGVRTGHELGAQLRIPISAENDARAAALGESMAHEGELSDVLYVKAGTGIGAGLVQAGELVHGGGGLAGDITHVHADGAEGLRCSCGREGCLETVASGAAIRRTLADAGINTASMADVISLANAFNPEATAAVRKSGTQLGRALAPLVTFLNPSAVLIGGSLSLLDPYVAAVRSAIYDSSLAMTTQDLVIEPSTTGRDAALLGLARIAQHLAPLDVGTPP